MVTTATAERVPAATFLQISDLHFGDVDPTSGDATLSSAAAHVVTNLTWFDGLLGHHGMALQQLEQFCAGPDLGENFEVIVTGDYSRCGSTSELNIARLYILADISLVPPGRTGLRLGKEKALIGIPGNHDQWAGRFHPVGGHPSNYPGVFPLPTLPWADSTRNVGGRKLVLAGIDSDDDVGPYDQSRVLAKGDFQSQLAKLGGMLGPRGQGEIRVLLIHQSWHRGGLTLRMRKASRQALEQFLDQYGFSLILTGHTHGPLLRSFTVGQANSTIRETRCGTTTQHDVTPYKWSSLLGTFPTRSKWPQNTLVVHKLYVDPGQTSWEAQVYERTRGKFRSCGHSGFVTFNV